MLGAHVKVYLSNYQALTSIPSTRSLITNSIIINRMYQPNCASAKFIFLPYQKLGTNVKTSPYTLTRFFSARFSSTALVATIIDEILISKAEISGRRIIPNLGYNTPAATGIASRL